MLESREEHVSLLISHSEMGIARWVREVTEVQFKVSEWHCSLSTVIDTGYVNALLRCLSKSCDEPVLHPENA